MKFVHVNNARSLWKLAAFIKGRDFAWEKEWRLVAMPTLEQGASDHDKLRLLDSVLFRFKVAMDPFTIEHRKKDDREIPYFKFSFPADYIIEVHVGSRNGWWHVEDGLKKMLEDHGIHAKIIDSSITFR